MTGEENSDGTKGVGWWVLRPQCIFAKGSGTEHYKEREGRGASLTTKTFNDKRGHTNNGLCSGSSRAMALTPRRWTSTGDDGHELDRECRADDDQISLKYEERGLSLG